jgi:hypothetical protein
MSDVDVLTRPSRRLRAEVEPGPRPADRRPLIEPWRAASSWRGALRPCRAVCQLSPATCRTCTVPGNVRPRRGSSAHAGQVAVLRKLMCCYVEPGRRRPARAQRGRFFRPARRTDRVGRCPQQVRTAARRQQREVENRRSAASGALPARRALVLAGRSS